MTASFYDRVGGEQTFRDLVDGFYQGRCRRSLLRALYPEEDLGPAADRLRLFLVQYWGGPRTYQETRGHLAANPARAIPGHADPARSLGAPHARGGRLAGVGASRGRGVARVPGARPTSW